MKNLLFKLAAAMVVALPLATGCEKGSYDLGKFWVNYGEVTGTAPLHTITLDDGSILDIQVNKVPYIQLNTGQRVIADFTIIGETPQPEGSPGRYSVILNGVIKILSKPFLYSDRVNTPEQQDSLGNDSIDIIDAWISSKYLNVKFNILRSDPQIIHMVNIVLDQERSNSDNYYFVFRHNAKGDIPSFRSFGRVSFDISDIINAIEPGHEIRVFLEWGSYSAENKTKEIIYRKL